MRQGLIYLTNGVIVCLNGLVNDYNTKNWDSPLFRVVVENNIDDARIYALSAGSIMCSQTSSSYNEVAAKLNDLGFQLSKYHLAPISEPISEDQKTKIDSLVKKLQQAGWPRKQVNEDSSTADWTQFASVLDQFLKAEECDTEIGR